jgi:hypothetical protein
VRFSDNKSGTKDAGLRSRSERPALHYLIEALKHPNVLGVYVACNSRWGRDTLLVLSLNSRVEALKKNFISATEEHMYVSLNNSRSFGPDFPITTARKCTQFVTLFADEMQQLSVSEHTKRSVTRRQISNIGSSSRAPFGHRFKYTTVDGVAVVSFKTVARDKRMPGAISIIEHQEEQFQMELLIECSKAGMKPKKMLESLRTRGVSEDTRLPGKEVNTKGLKDKIASFQERRMRIMEVMRISSGGN